MTTASTIPVPLVARSNDGSLIGVHHTATNNTAGVIRCYDGNVSNGSLKFTLRVPAAATTLSSSAGGGDAQNALSKLAFAHGGPGHDAPRHLCGLLRPSPSSSAAAGILVWDLDRGVLAHTIDVRDTASKKKKRKASVAAAARTEVVCDIAAHGDQLYALVLFPGDDENGSSGKGKCRVYQYDLAAPAATLVRKIKVGSTSASSAGLAISRATIAVRMGHHLRVLDLNTGERRGKIDIPSVMSTNEEDDESGAPTSAAPLCITSDGRYILTTTAHNQVVVFSDEEELKMTALCSTKDDTSPISNLDFTLGKAGVDDLTMLAFQPLVGIASLFSISAKSQTPERTMVPQMPQAQLHSNTKEPASSPAFIHAGFHSRNPQESLLLLFQVASKQRRGGSAAGSGTTLPMESLAYAGLEGRVLVGTSLAMEDKNTKGDGKKRKSAECLALAPGDQGQEAAAAVDLTLGQKLAKVPRQGDGEDKEDDLFNIEEDGEQGQSIAERLALLSSAMEQTDDEEDEEEDEQGESNKTDAHRSKFKLKSATSETLSTLLTQALSSNDAVQLNIALQVTDRRLVEGTVRALQLLDAERSSEQAAGYVSTLMAHIVRRMARRHSLVMPLGVWIRAILAAAASSTQRGGQSHAGGGGNSGTDERMAKEGREMAMKLGPLKNFLNERVESFPQLLRLEGRLGLLNQQL